MNAQAPIKAFARGDREIAEPIKRTPPRGNPAEADLRKELRRELTPNEYCVLDVLLCADWFTFTGTVPQLAATAGLTLKQCKVARQSLKRRGMVKVTMNADRAHRGRHNSSMALGDEAQRAFQAARLNHTKMSVNNGLGDQKALEGPRKAQVAADVSKAPQGRAIYREGFGKKDSTEIDISAEAGRVTGSSVFPGQIQKLAAPSGVPSGQSSPAGRRFTRGDETIKTGESGRGVDADGRFTDHEYYSIREMCLGGWTDEEIVQSRYLNVTRAEVHSLRMDLLRAPTHTRIGVMKDLVRNQTHPEWMHRGTLDWRDNPKLKPGQRMVHLFEELTRRGSTGPERGILKWLSERAFVAATPEEFLTWAVENWSIIGIAIFDWADGYPAEPCLPWLRADVNFDYFWFAHAERANLEGLLARLPVPFLGELPFGGRRLVPDLDPGALLDALARA
ncbi:MAG: hypothetical protein IH905_09140 [Proteobacteria bacterium]|nr:hypothetical protein [Pseudomonadota bacterium]